jgi:hypothetical protein
VTTLPNARPSVPGNGRAPGDAPPPPGSLGAPVDVGMARVYLEALTGWRDRLRAALGDLDARTRRATAGNTPSATRDTAKATADVTLAFALWQAVSDRTDEMIRLYDNGRLGRSEAEQLSVLIWGRLDGTATGGGLPVSFVEACTLVCSLIGRLAAEVAVADRAGVALARLDDLRVRLLVVQQPGTAAGVLDRAHAATLRLSDLASRVTAGSHVDAEIAELDAALAGLESDVAAARAHAATVTSLAGSLPARLSAATERARSVHALAQRCADKIAGAPRLGIPDPAMLGRPPVATPPPSPDEEATVLAFAARLARVETALTEAEARYEAPLTERDDLRGLLRSYQAKAVALGIAEQPSLSAAYDAARQVLWSAPCDLMAARALTDAYVAMVPAGSGAATGEPDDRPVRARRGAEDGSVLRSPADETTSEEP